MQQHKLIIVVLVIVTQEYPHIIRLMEFIFHQVQVIKDIVHSKKKKKKKKKKQK